MQVDKTPSKRSYTDIEDDGVALTPRGAAPSLAASSNSDVKAIVAKAFSDEKKALQMSLLSAIEGHVETIIEKASSLTGERLSNLETGMHRMEENQKLQNRELANFKNEVLDKLEILANGRVPPTPTPDMSGSDNGNGSGPSESPLAGFNRQINFGVLFCNTIRNIKVSRTRFHEVIVKLAAEVGLADDSFNLVGDTLDDRFEICWLGNPSTAKSRCIQFYQSLQLGRGKWKPQVVLDDQENEIQFFVGPDKNPCQVRREVLSKNLKDLIGGHIPAGTIFVKKTAGTLYIDKRPLVTIHVSGPDSARLAWNPTKVSQYKLDMPLIEEAFQKLVLGELSS